MNIKYTECPRPRKAPCLMKNEFGEGFYVTRINCNAEDVETRESDLKNYEPLLKGTIVELIKAVINVTKFSRWSGVLKKVHEQGKDQKRFEMQRVLGI